MESRKIKISSNEDPPLRLAVFASGSGTNFEAICDAIDARSLDAVVVLCVSDRDNAGVLQRADARGIKTAVVNPADFPGEADFSLKLLELLGDSRANFIALAGYLRKVSAVVIEAFRNRIVNIHPALLPNFGGKGMYGFHVHRAVIACGARVSGATVHIVDEAFDTGPIVAQCWVEVCEDETPESLAERILAVEHKLYPTALQLFALGRVRVDESGVSIVQPSERHPD
jgi:phosphoribosylglycinamide formyltransferase-1